MRKATFITFALAIFLALTPAFAASVAASPQPYVYFGDDSPEAVAYLGVDTRNLTPEMLAPLHLKSENGVEVTMVDQDAPAGKAGIKEHDVILGINGEAVESMEQLRRLIREIPPGRMVTIELSRGGHPLTVKTELASRKEVFNFHFEPQNFHFEMPAVPNLANLDVPVSVVVVHSALHSGLMLETLSPQLGNYFGVKGNHGVLVRSVEKGSLAEKTGFRAGDVIVSVNGQPVRDGSDVGDQLRARKSSTVSIGIVRDRKEQTLILKLPPRDQSRETFPSPEISEEMRRNLSQLDAEMAKLRPQIDAAVAQSRKAAEEAVQQAMQSREVWQRQAQEMRNRAQQFRKQWQEQEREQQHREQMHSKGFDI